MKQKIHNQKLVNWHKPLQTGEWKSAYLRNREDSPQGGGHWRGGGGAHQERCVHCGSLGCADFGANPMRCAWREEADENCHFYTDGDGEDAVETFETAMDYLFKGSERNVFGRLAFSNQIPLPIDLVDGARLEVLQGGAGKRISEEELAVFFEELIHSGNGKENRGDAGPLELEHVRRALQPAPVGAGRGEMKAQDRDYLTRLMALFAGYRTRGISDWRASTEDSRRAFAELARHLFCQYPVPAWLDAVWGASGAVRIAEIQRSLKWACWFVCIGGGGSVRKLARLMGVRMTDRTAAHLHEAPAHLMPELACMWAEAAAVTGKRRVADWLLKHQGYYIDPTVFPRGKRNVKFARFWLGTVQWLARYEHELTDEQAAELLEWGWYKFEDSLGAGGAAFSWSGRTPRKCLEEAPGYLQNALRALGGEANKRWEARGVSWEFAETDSGETADVWRFQELTQSSDLWEEGVAMRHCVAKYDGSCSDGGTVVVSLRRNGARALTIELQWRGLALGQVKGRFNREPTAEESQVVRCWVNEVVRGRARSRRR
jgi:hypothetical protein